MSKEDRTYILITGASSGIGEGFARAYARRGKSLVLVARREERLSRLAEELSNEEVDVRWVVSDLQDAESPANLFRACAEQGWEIEGLINNAGLGTQKGLIDLSEEEFSRMINVNLFALTRLMYLFLPGMMKRGSGFVLNVASTAAFQPVPYLSVYAATKAYVVSLSEAVYEEVKGSGVTVSCLCPGPVATEFQGKAGMDPRFFAQTQGVESVVKAGLKLIEGRGALGWTSIFQRIFSLGSELTPHGFRRRMAARLIRASVQKEN